MSMLLLIYVCYLIKVSSVRMMAVVERIGEPISGYNLWYTYDTSSSSILGSDYLTS